MFVIVGTKEMRVGLIFVVYWRRGSTLGFGCWWRSDEWVVGFGLFETSGVVAEPEEELEILWSEFDIFEVIHEFPDCHWLGWS